MNKLSIEQNKSLVEFLKCFSSDDYLELEAINLLYNELIETTSGTFSSLKIPSEFFIKDLINEKYVLTSFDEHGLFVRYYPLLFSKKHLIESLNIKDNSKISITKLFNNNLEKMEKWDIREEYELYDLLRKTIDFNDYNFYFSKFEADYEMGYNLFHQNIFTLN